MAGEPTSVRAQVRQFFALERDVLVLSVAMFAFSLGFQMTSRYLGEYMIALGGALYGGVALPGAGTVGSPPFAFGMAMLIGLVGTGYFLVFGEDFDAAGQ
jgi:hypothetical protein